MWSHLSHVVTLVICVFIYQLCSHLSRVVTIVTCRHTCHMWSHLSHVVTLVTCGHTCQHLSLYFLQIHQPPLPIIQLTRPLPFQFFFIFPTPTPKFYNWFLTDLRRCPSPSKVATLLRYKTIRCTVAPMVKNLYGMQFNFQVVDIYQIFLTPNGTRWPNSSFRRFSLGDLEIMARNYFKHKVNGCELKSSRGCVFSRPSLLPLPRRRREGESGLPTIASFLRSVWLVIGFGKSWALLRIFGLRTQPGSRQGIRYYLPLYGQQAHWHLHTASPITLLVFYPGTSLHEARQECNWNVWPVKISKREKTSLQKEQPREEKN